MEKVKISEQELIERFNEVLDTSVGTRVTDSGELIVFGYTFNPSQVLKNCDPTAYRCELADFADSIRDDFEVENY